MTTAPLLIVILAAGRGVRMRSQIPKVLHGIGGRPMIGHVLARAREAAPPRLASPRPGGGPPRCPFQFHPRLVMPPPRGYFQGTILVIESACFKMLTIPFPTLSPSQATSPTRKR